MGIAHLGVGGIRTLARMVCECYSSTGRYKNKLSIGTLSQTLVLYQYIYSLLEECRHYIFGSYVMAFIIKEKMGSKKVPHGACFTGGGGGGKSYLGTAR